MNEELDEFFMSKAIKQAAKCNKSGDVPVGAVIVFNGKIIAAAYNKKEKLRCATAHAEMLAINAASKKLKNFRLTDCKVYITKEPCLMCMGALLSARVEEIIFGAYDKKYPTHHLASENNFNHTCKIKGGIMESECQQLLTNFFTDLRAKN